jgi:16S rRNA C1402 (ribose-2'-O) methylase RsmI
MAAIKYFFFMSLLTFYYNLPYGPTALLLRDFLLTNSQHNHEKKCFGSYLPKSNKKKSRYIVKWIELNVLVIFEFVSKIQVIVKVA